MNQISEDEVLKKLPTVSYKKVEAALESAAKHYPGNKEDIQFTFEYLIGSFFPNIYENMRETIREVHTKAYMEGFNDGKNL